MVHVVEPVITSYSIHYTKLYELCALNVFGAVASSALVAYGFARMRFPGKDLLFFILIATMALPRHVTMIPVFVIFKAMGWYGSLLPLIVPAFLGHPFYIFLLSYNFV